ncbi:MAG: 4Fe-4S dicluster domain-containing protein [Fidelibacterota bacterium]
MQFILLFIAIASFFMFIGFSIISFIEKENLAFKRFLLYAITVPLPFLGIAFLNISIVSIITLILLAAVILIIYIPDVTSFVKKSRSGDISFRIDERDIMFSRARLKSNSQNYHDYYQSNPEKKDIDDTIRRNPGLLSKTAKYYSPYFSEAAEANFSVTQHLHGITKPEIKPDQQELDPKDTTRFVINWLLKNGAVDAGVTRLQKYHLYSHRGYGEKYGSNIINNHTNVIVFLLQMDKEMIAHAPKTPVVLESSQQYLNSAILAVSLAKFIANLGYSATAHIDGKYDIIAPLVARDCGLGEIGRMGLLISGKFGPRVRIAAVTTDLPLHINSVLYDASIEKFCKICKKCAKLCPSQAIPYDDPSLINGSLRWQIHQEKCYGYWTQIGTDCARCIQVCPFSHNDNLFHNTIRFGIRHFPVFRRIALLMDDMIYGNRKKKREMTTP